MLILSLFLQLFSIFFPFLLLILLVLLFEDLQSLIGYFAFKNPALFLIAEHQTSTLLDNPHLLAAGAHCLRLYAKPTSDLTIKTHINQAVKRPSSNLKLGLDLQRSDNLIKLLAKRFLLSLPILRAFLVHELQFTQIVGQIEVLRL